MFKRTRKMLVFAAAGLACALATSTARADVEIEYWHESWLLRLDFYRRCRMPLRLHEVFPTNLRKQPKHLYHGRKWRIQQSHRSITDEGLQSSVHSQRLCRRNHTERHESLCFHSATDRGKARKCQHENPGDRNAHLR